MIELGRKMGIKSWDNLPPIGLSLTLGGAEVTMLDMARVYQTIANLGVKKDIKIVKEIKDYTGTEVTDKFYHPKNKELALVEAVEAKDNEQVISPLAAYWLTDIMADNVARLPAFGHYARLTVGKHKVAVKTGTSNNFRDNWTIGFSPDYLTAVWVGNNDGSFMNKNLVSGITGAAPIWNDMMTELLANTDPKDFQVPTGLIAVKVCATNGLLTCPNCPMEKTEYFTADKIPTKKCFFRSRQDCDEAKKQAEGKSDEEKKQLLANCPY
jgi:membrane carboxypeptidase/penicillin-binding protein